MSFLGPILASVAGSAVGGLMGNSNSGGGGTTTMVNELPEWLQPYYTGGSDGYAGNVPGAPPLSDDYLYWNAMAGMGNPIGPPPPMYTDDPRYTGENVYQAPSQFMNPMGNIATTGIGGLLGPPQQPAAGPMGLMGPMAQNPGGGQPQYPSQMRPPGQVAAQTPPPAAPPQGMGGTSGLDDIVGLANNYMSTKNRQFSRSDTTDRMDFGQAMQWALRNQGNDNPYRTTR